MEANLIHLSDIVFMLTASLIGNWNWFIVLDFGLPSLLRIRITESKSIASFKMDTLRLFSAFLIFIQNPRFTTGSDSRLFIHPQLSNQTLKSNFQNANLARQTFKLCQNNLFTKLHINRRRKATSTSKGLVSCSA